MPTPKTDDTAFPVLAGIAGPIVLAPVAFTLARPAFAIGGWFLVFALAGLVMAAGPLYAAVVRRSIGWALWAAVVVVAPFVLVVGALLLVFSGQMG